ncbi:Endonuclease/exonuclease/phosphatase [Macrophomina phaseolina MS6]|uniref:Endonuclease/exonuclease/phosphatase n=2 Tax=Macrophomina phaseolina TaxID=35725 RepID=K2RSF1_MACPH|nr:Endonuclease/exonuclease/phosphatase [Macrophomina phaseolina MS6]KAH7064638.1 Endonuclease/exonuclease/phosphatase [Macrophomina phaseolina]
MDSRLSDDTPKQIRIISLNCWGLKFLAKFRHERLSEIGRQLAAASPPPDIIGLQECWTKEDYESIRDTLREKLGLQYSKFYYSGIFGGGLVIISRWPIEETSMVRYPLNGRPTAFFRGDWFVGKGVACARIRFGKGKKDVAEVFCTHLHAPYEREPNDSYICHRTAQAWEIAKLMRGAAERGHLVLGLGDFNMIPLSLAHRLIEAHSPVRDVWRIKHPDSSIGAARDEVEQKRGRPMPNARFNITENGATCDSALNTWRWNEAHRKRLEKGLPVTVEDTVEDPRAKRLDYIFFSCGESSPSANNDTDWVLDKVDVGMMQRHPQLRCSLSDHFSVEVTIRRADNSSPPNGHSAPSRPLSPVLPVSAYDEILAMIQKYTAREYRQRRFRLCHFVGQFFLAIGCLIAVWWSPRNFVSFILMLVSTLGLSAGVIDGLIGGLFVGSELRALREFEWEIRNAKEAAAAAGQPADQYKAADEEAVEEMPQESDSADGV